MSTGKKKKMIVILTENYALSSLCYFLVLYSSNVHIIIICWEYEGSVALFSV